MPHRVVSSSSGADFDILHGEAGTVIGSVQVVNFYLQSEGTDGIRTILWTATDINGLKIQGDDSPLEEESMHSFANRIWGIAFS
jgi:hypothetical protein